jgi:hypothetical protein
MAHMRHALLAAVLALLWTGGFCAQDKPHEVRKGEGAVATSQPAQTHPGFEKLKKLAGEWLSADEPAEPNRDRKEAAETRPVCIYKVTSAGSVVQETLLPGTPHEMVTMYYQEGPDLVLTHYCALGNQPRMKAEPPTAPDKLEFKFAGGSNINPGKDAHMHDLTLTFVDPDHLRATWTLYQNGQPSKVETFELKRKR